MTAAASAADATETVSVDRSEVCDEADWRRIVAMETVSEGGSWRKASIDEESMSVASS